jgi:hypothetical protein
MNPLLLPGIFDMAGKMLDRFFPDPTERAKAEFEMVKMQQEGAFKELDAQLQMALAQARINEAEANNSNPWVSGWRPAVGWIGVATLAYQYLLRPMLPWAFSAAGHAVPELPELDDGMWEMVALMLGFGGLRTYDKKRGNA